MTATVNILKDLVGFATVSRDPNRALIDYVADRLASTNADVRIIPDENGGKANLFATTGPRDRGGVMLSGHTDVVPVDGQEWTVPAFACTEMDGRLYGRGTADMKGFVASALHAFEVAADTELATPLHLALSYDEELGCLGVRSMIDMLAAAPVRRRCALSANRRKWALPPGTRARPWCAPTAPAWPRIHRWHHWLSTRCILPAIWSAPSVRARNRLSRTARMMSAYNIPYTTLHVGRIEGGVQVNIVLRRHM